MMKISLTVAACAALLWAGTVLAGPTPEQKCQQKKLKAQGKLQLCLKKNAAGVVAGKADGSADCRSKFTTALGKADAAAAKKGAACRYLDNGDGTVSDLNTGLVWEKKDNTCPGAHCVNDWFTWSNSGSAPDGTAFTSFLATLNNGTSTDGGATTPITGCFTDHCDWRLPTIVELQGIVDMSAPGCGSGSPCIDPAFGPTQAYGYWSATANAGYPYGAWGVDFHFGSVGYDYKTYDGYVRAVRGGL